MNDLISRQYAIEHYQHVCRRTNCKECPLHIQVTDTLTDCELELFLHNLPSAQPEIVRCKDCKHRPERLEEGKGEGFNLEFPDDNFKCPCQCDDGWYNWMPDDNWFCGDAERKEE